MITLWQQETSPNARRVRIALGLKGARYEAIEASDGKQDEVIKVSGQPLTPVLRHNDTIMFDSGAILRYIDANIEGPKIFSTVLEEMRAIERWESHAREILLQPFLAATKQVMSGEMDAAKLAAAKTKYLDGAREVQGALNANGVLVGSRFSVADITCAAYLAYAYLTPELAARKKNLKWARENLVMDDSMAKLTSWFEKLRAAELQQRPG